MLGRSRGWRGCLSAIKFSQGVDWGSGSHWLGRCWWASVCHCSAAVPLVSVGIGDAWPDGVHNSISDESRHMAWGSTPSLTPVETPLHAGFIIQYTAVFDREPRDAALHDIYTSKQLM